jgi:hypothetical protein
MLIIIKCGKSINNRRDMSITTLFILLPDLIKMSITTVIYTITRLDNNEYHDGYSVVILIITKSGKSINYRRDTHYNQVW